MDDSHELSCAQLDTLEFIQKVGRVSIVTLRKNTARSLIRKGLLEYDESNYLVLTTEGRSVAERNGDGR